MTNLIFKVAGHSFQLSFTNKYFNKQDLFNLLPFASENEKLVLFNLCIEKNIIEENKKYRCVGDFHDDIASIKIFKREDTGDYYFQITHPSGGSSCIMETNSSFTIAKAYLSNDPIRKLFYLNNCLMLLYAFRTSSLDTILVHASVVKNETDSFLFLGKSGTGKSTHSQLWINHIKNTELLNDDNPVLRFIEDKVYVFGSPWSGKTDCYKNASALLKGILQLEQAPSNEIKNISLLQAYANLLPACSCLKWEKVMMNHIHQTVDKIITQVPSYHLKCLPDKEAALLSYNTMTVK